MKKLVLPLLLFLSVISFAQHVDVLHYSYQVILNDDNDSIQGIATIQTRFTEAGNEVVFDLASIRRDGKGMKTISAEGPGFRNLQHRDNKLRISSSKNFAVGDTATWVIRYSGIPADGLIISKNKFGHRTFFADNWPDRAHNWIPCVDDPADKATVEFIVVAPLHYQVVSNGVQTEESNMPGNWKLTRWRSDEPLPTKVMVIGVADFAVDLAGTINDCIPVTTWVFPENKAEGFKDYSDAPAILSWLSSYIGPYPYRKLANIQSKTIFGGMENASAIFYFENSVNGKREQESLFAHEITHQWFGNTATEKNFAHLWLSEGFATYLTHMYLESKYGVDSLNKRMMKDREESVAFVNSIHHPVVDTTHNLMSLLNENSYQKGGWVLHMLRRQLGDSLFRKAVRTYYATYAWKNADTRDLQKVFETVTGKDLGVFFDQWLYKGVNPKLKINWTYLTNDRVISVTVEQLQPDVFVFPLDIGIGNRVESLKVTKRSETFRIRATTKPARIIADPNISLLFEGTVVEK